MKLTLDELITLMEPQAQRDKKLIVQCIDGLTEYAAELRQKAGDAGKAESSALRELIDRLEGYWGLDNSGENRLSAFDRRMREAEQSEQPWAPVQDQINGAVLGLYRYAMDMIPGQGASEAAEQVAECERLMRNIAAFWNCASPSLDSLCSQMQEALRDQSEWMSRHAHEVEKFCMFFHSVKEAQQYLPRFTAIEGVEVVQGAPDNIEVTAAGVNKGESLLALADHLGIPREATLAVGDSENDRAMLEKAGVAAVMANGMEQIRKLADIVSENDNDHDGVAEIFARLGL